MHARVAWSGAIALGLAACQLTPTDIYGGVFAAEADSDDAAGAQRSPGDGSGEGPIDVDDVDDVDDDGEDGEDGEDHGAEPSMYDVGPGGTQAELPEPCREVDLLFVIDDSGSMGDEQLNLVASFPGFIDGITQRLGPATSYHVGVITTDAYEWNVPHCQAIGGLTVRTGGDLSSDDHCGPYASGGSYMTVDDDLADVFSCAAQVGIDGAGVERPMDALVAALTDPEGQTDACNDGFLRDEALLVVVLITDEEDEGDSLGDPLDWYDTVVDAKAGDEDAVVVLSLIGHDKPNACIPAQWTGMMGAEISPRLRTFTELFPHGTVGDVCAPDYGPFFAEAVDGIAAACGLGPQPAG